MRFFAKAAAAAFVVALTGCAAPPQKRVQYTGNTQDSASLFAESLDIVFAESSKGPDSAEATHKTVRYAEGGGERMERAAVLTERCDRIVLRTLRGWLMSVPRPAEACEGELAASAQAASAVAK